MNFWDKNTSTNNIRKYKNMFNPDNKYKYKWRGDKLTMVYDTDDSDSDSDDYKYTDYKYTEEYKYNKHPNKKNKKPNTKKNNYYHQSSSCECNSSTDSYNSYVNINKKHKTWKKSYCDCECNTDSDSDSLVFSNSTTKPTQPTQPTPIPEEISEPLIIEENDKYYYEGIKDDTTDITMVDFGNGVVQPSAPPPPQSESSFQSEMLERHNFWRNRLNIENLVWSEELASLAQEWANYMLSDNFFAHRTGTDYGENLYQSSGRSPTAQQVVDLWGNEVEFYNYNTNTCQPGKMCGHYTQIIWRDTKRVGCAKASDGTSTYVVCNYDPAGNFVGEKPY